MSVAPDVLEKLQTFEVLKMVVVIEALVVAVLKVLEMLNGMEVLVVDVIEYNGDA